VTKSLDAFRTISEVAEDLNLPQHVLRFWETRFSHIQPMKRGGGRRYYPPDDVELLRGIQHLLYEEGYTIKGVQRILKDSGNKYVIAAGRGEELSVSPGEPVTAGAKQAIPVAEVMAGNNDKKGKGLFKRLVGKDSKVENLLSPVDITGDERNLLQATLYDLLECKRLLDQAR